MRITGCLAEFIVFTIIIVAMTVPATARKVSNEKWEKKNKTPSHWANGRGSTAGRASQVMLSTHRRRGGDALSVSFRLYEKNR
jgi:hypothetical protein